MAVKSLLSHRLVRGFGVTLMSEGVLLACQIISFVILVLLIPATEYGEYSGILGITTSVGALVWQAIPLVVLESTARHPAGWHVQYSRALFCFGLSFPFALAVTGALTHFIIPSARVWIALVVITGDLALWFTHSVAASRQATRGMRSAATVRSVLAVVRAVGLVVGALISTQLASVVIFGSAMTWIAALLLLLRGHEFHLRRPDRAFISALSSYQIGGSAASVQEEIDKTFVLRISGETAAAHYSAGFRLFQVLALPLRALTGTMHTQFVVDQHNPREAVRRLIRVSKLTLLYGFAAWGVLAGLAVALTRYAPDRFGTDASLIVILGAILPVRALVPNSANLLVGLGRRVFRAMSQLFGCVLAIVLYLTLAPVHGPRGAAIASLIAEVGVLIALWGALLLLGKKPAHGAPIIQRRNGPRHRVSRRGVRPTNNSR